MRIDELTLIQERESVSDYGIITDDETDWMPRYNCGVFYFMFEDNDEEPIMFDATKERLELACWLHDKHNYVDPNPNYADPNYDHINMWYVWKDLEEEYQNELISNGE